MDSIIGLVMVVGPVYGYYSQYAKVKQEKTVGNFSIDVCAILIFANILRILFWFGERYELPLLFQSILMIITQGVLLMECLKHNSNGYYSSRDGGISSAKFWGKFWRWENSQSYANSIAVFTVASTLITLMFITNDAAVQLIGTSSAIIEATLGFPQFIKNYKSKNASGISYGLIGSWFLGDFGKTVYFVYKGAPFQFLMTGIIQLTVDILIILQMMFYKSK